VAGSSVMLTVGTMRLGRSNRTQSRSSLNAECSEYGTCVATACRILQNWMQFSCSCRCSSYR